jgi:hypothetical protein
VYVFYFFPLSFLVSIIDPRNFCVISGCQFHPVGDYLRFVRVPENVPVGGEILRVQVQPKGLLSIQPMDKVKYEKNSVLVL